MLLTSVKKISLSYYFPEPNQIYTDLYDILFSASSELVEFICNWLNFLSIHIFKPLGTA